MLPIKPLQAPHCCHPYLLYTDFDIIYSCTNLDTIFYKSALALSEKKVLYVLQSRSQAACLIASLQEKTTYKSVFFQFSGSGARDALQKKATGGTTSKVIRGTAGWTRLDMTLGTSIATFTTSSLYDEGPPFLCDRGSSFLYNGNSKRSRRNFRWSSGFT